MGHYLVDSCSFWVSYLFFTTMNLRQIDFSQVLTDDQVYEHVMSHYEQLGRSWTVHQWNWVNNMYWTFKDHYKYMIVISLKEKTLQFYDTMNIHYTYDEYYSKSYLHIEKFSITELCDKLNLPKETVRRKVLELENLGVLKRQKKQIIIDRNSFKIVKPEQQMKFTAKYIFLISQLLNKEKIYSKKLDLEFIENILKNNFSLVWRWFYRMQIPMAIGYGEIFNDLTTFHIFGTVVMNQTFNLKKNFNISNINSISPDYITFTENLIGNDGSSTGLSAMSISDMTSIPRATVIRKCKYLLKNDFLKLNEKKQYIMSGSNIAKILPYHKQVLKNKSKFLRKVLNLLTIS